MKLNCTTTLIGLIGLAAIARLLPHPPNFTPIMAMALVAGCHFADRRLAFVVPLAAMLFTDAVLGFHATLPHVYAGVVLTALIGMGLRGRTGVATVAGASLAGSLTFFAVTNLGVWQVGGLYAPDAAGLVACYVAALPFLENSIAGDLIFTALLFGGHALAVRQRPLIAT
jgi:hypothetical protein